MPTYEYFCAANDERVEALHRIDEKVETWGQLCRVADRPLGATPADAPVVKLISAPGLAFPKSNADLKNMGFSKLVRRDKGVYENVTAQEGESRFVRSDDPGSMAAIAKKVRD